MKNILIVHQCNINFGNGGVERYIRVQIDLYNKKNIGCYLIFPIRKKILNMYFEFWGLLYNKRYIGIYKTDEVSRLIKEIEKKGKIDCINIHHLMNINIDELKKILQIILDRKTEVYLHDYYTACIQYNLLKNGENYCGSATLEKEKCRDCLYYEEACKNKKKIMELFQLLEKELVFISPSEFTKKMWTTAYKKYDDRVIIRPHLCLIGKYKGNCEALDNKKIRIAFLGSQNKNKGWDKWVKATEQLFHPDIELYYLGSKVDNRENIKNVFVSIEKNGENAMVDALRSNDIDCVVLFSICPETYSYTYFEAMAANCYVITNFDSGNISQEVIKRKNGIVISNSANKLHETISDSVKLRQNINEFRISSDCGPMNLINNINIDTNNDSDMMQAVQIQCTFSLSKKIMGIMYKHKYRNYLIGD